MKRMENIIVVLLIALILISYFLFFVPFNNEVGVKVKVKNELEIMKPVIDNDLHDGDEQTICMGL